MHQERIGLLLHMKDYYHYTKINYNITFKTDIKTKIVIVLAKKLLVIGGSGLVGSTIIQSAYENYDIHFTYNKTRLEFSGIDSTCVDLMTDRNKIVSLIYELKPNFIINTAAHSSVDQCETNHEEADLLHVDITKDIALACKKINSKLVYLSTDAVFEGQLNKKYIESDTPNPVNYYGKSKLYAEKVVLDASSINVVLRTAVIYGWHPRSRFTGWILDSLLNNKCVDTFIDQYNTPTLVDDLTNSILKIFDLGICGLYHATGATCINRYDFALKLAEKFNLNKSLIVPVTSKEKKQVAPRGVSTCLNSQKLENAISYNFASIDKGIDILYRKSRQ